MATVRMKKGVKYADVFDSPETIRNAQLDGYSLCEEEKAEKKVEEPKVETTEKQSDEQSEVKVVHKKSTKK